MPSAGRVTVRMPVACDEAVKGEQDDGPGDCGDPGGEVEEPVDGVDAEDDLAEDLPWPTARSGRLWPSPAVSRWAEARDAACGLLAEVQAVHGLPVTERAMGVVALVVSEAT